MVGGGQGCLNLPLPVPFNPGSHPDVFGPRPFAFSRLRNIAQCCVIFPFFSHFPPPWNPASRPLFSRTPAAPFSPGLPPPVPPTTCDDNLLARTILSCCAPFLTVHVAQSSICGSKRPIVSIVLNVMQSLVKDDLGKGVTVYTATVFYRCIPSNIVEEILVNYGVSADNHHQKFTESLDLKLTSKELFNKLLGKAPAKEMYAYWHMQELPIFPCFFWGNDSTNLMQFYLVKPVSY